MGPIGPVVEEVGAAFDTFWNSPWAIPINEIKTKKVTREEDHHVRDSRNYCVDPSLFQPEQETDEQDVGLP